MRKRFPIGVMLVGIILAAAAPTLRGADAPTAEAPKFSAGEEWHYSNGAVFRIEATEADQTVTSLEFPGNRCPGCRQYRNQNLTVVSIVDKAGAPIADASIGLKTLDFPLEVGKTWESNQILPELSTGRLIPYENYFKVEGYGDVKTKAGVFKAFKIGWRQESKGAYRWTGNATLWYSPEVRTIVKREAHTSGWFKDSELVSFKTQ